METIRLAGMINDSIVDGPGLRLVIFTQGCNHKCKGCHNPESWSFEGGEEYQIDFIIEKIKRNPLLSGITLSGGEPLCQPQQCGEIAKEAKAMGLNVMLFTGYTYEELIELEKENKDIEYILKFVDIMVDGRFEIEERDLSLRYRGSKNQRIINFKKSKEENNIVIMEEYM